MSNILYAIELGFTFCAIAGIFITFYNVSESRKNLWAIHEAIRIRAITNDGHMLGRLILARMTRRRSLLSLVMYVLLVVVGMTAISEGPPEATTTAVLVRVMLGIFVVLMLIGDIFDIYDRIRAMRSRQLYSNVLVE